MADDPMERLHAALVRATREGKVRWVPTGFGAYGTRVGPWDIEISAVVPTHRQREVLTVRTAGQETHRVGRQEFDTLEKAKVGDSLIALVMRHQESEDSAVEGILKLLTVLMVPLLFLNGIVDATLDPGRQVPGQQAFLVAPDVEGAGFGDGLGADHVWRGVGGVFEDALDEVWGWASRLGSYGPAGGFEFHDGGADGLQGRAVVLSGVLEDGTDERW